MNYFVNLDSRNSVLKTDQAVDLIFHYCRCFAVGLLSYIVVIDISPLFTSIQFKEKRYFQGTS